MKIFRMNDCDWMIGPTLEECIAYFQEEYSGTVEDARELTDEELDTLIFCDSNVHDIPVARRTFRKQIQIEVANGGSFPRFFASTEY